MDESTGRRQLVQTGRKLLEKGLVARTWGNVSCRLDDTRFLITPSGLDYTRTTESDIVIYDRISGEYAGKRKPSSEKGVHAAAYELFPDIGFVIHTHQTYATALGLAGWDSMDITDDEKARLGGIARADYGLPGQKALKDNVRKAMETGARIVLMVSHGAVICGADMDDALEKAALLEEICKRNCKGLDRETNAADAEKAEALMARVSTAIPAASLLQTDALLLRAATREAIPAQLDDMAQMVGRRIPVAPMKARRIIRKLRKHGAVLVPSLGCIVAGHDEDDTEALGLLADKAAVSALHCAASGVQTKLSGFDIALMHLVYKMKYSKQKSK